MNKNYDFDKAKKLIEEHKESITEAALGMHEDWFWTAETIWEDGEYKRALPSTLEANRRNEEYFTRRQEGMSLLSDEGMSYSDYMIGGIFGSNWATPTLQLRYKDGSGEMISCYQQIEDNTPFEEKIATVASNQAMLLGCLSGPVQERITPLKND